VRVSWFGLKAKVHSLSMVWPQTNGSGFLVWPQNQGRRFVSCLASKPLGRVSWFGPQNWQLRFGDLELKITTTVSLFRPQNQAGYGLSVAPQNRREDEVACVILGFYAKTMYSSNICP
jgi:hypothetical protein